MNLGAHMSIAGGLHLADDEAKAAGCSVLQIFTKSSNQWAARPLSDDDVKSFKVAGRASGIGPVVAHDSYLINLGSPNPALWEKSLAAFTHEVERCEQLGVSALIMHPGAHVGSGEEACLTRIAAAFDRCHADTRGYKSRILLEATAGQGTNVGYKFEHLRAILDRVAEPDRVGVCFDTCHVFAAGYDLRTRWGYDLCMQEFDRIVGLKKLEAFHLNDAKKDCGSRVDRHEHIGRGFLGLEPFRFLVNDPRFRKVPMILETPKEGGMDPVNLATLRGLREEMSKEDLQIPLPEGRSGRPGRKTRNSKIETRIKSE